MAAVEEQARSVFFAALERTAEHWPAFLDAACNGDADLRARVGQLLDAHRAMGGMPDAATTVDEPAPSEAPGTFVGRYKLLEPIGEGGFGIVFLAEQSQPVRRKVAVKILKPGMDTRQVVARFEAERQALAMMDHPNIAKVFDGGATPTGRPFFAMELVRGVPITDFCDQNRLTTRRRLELFLGVCQAVQHAHQKGIIHRDLKPSNVLVTVHDTEPVVKVIDFGVAKALGQELTDKTLFTGFAQLVGTPLYMSPEQAGLSSLDIDTRSDIYSLGVLLYELLTGTTPFDRERLRAVGLDEVRRIIREEEPARPSTRMSTLAAAAATVSANRGSDPGSLSRLLRGELDWIVMKALEKDRTRRYESAGAFAADVRRYLADEPVLARPPSARYRLGKFLRRNRGPVLAATLVAVAAVGGGIGAAYGWIEARNQREVTSLWQQAEGDRAAAEAARDEAEAARERLAAVEYGRTMQLAYQEWRDNNVPATLALLDRTRADLRGWEWRYVHRLCHSELLALRGHTEAVFSAAFSPDGGRVVTGGDDNTARVWDATTGAELLALKGHAANGPFGGVYSAAFSPDGGRVVTGGGDRTARVWDATTGTELLALKGHAGEVRSAAFSPDGLRVVTGGRDGIARVWDANSGAEVLALKGHNVDRFSVGVWSAAFSPDGLRVVTGGGDRMARVWDATTGAELLALKGHAGEVRSAAFGPDGGRVVTGSSDGTARVWDANSGAEVLALKGHTGAVISAAFSPDRGQVVTSGEDRTARVWDARTGAEVLVLRGHARDVWSAAFSPDGRRVVTGSFDGTARVWDAKTEPGSLALRGHTRGVASSAFSPDGGRVVTGGFDFTARVWDARTGVERLTLLGKSAAIPSVAFSPDGGRVVTGSLLGGAGTAQMWDAVSGAELLALKGHTGEVWSAAFSPDGGRVVTGGGDGTARVWDAWTGAELLAHRPHTDPVKREGKGAFTVGRPDTVKSVAFSPDGGRVVTGGFDFTARVWDAKTGTEVVALRGHASSVGSAAFSPDGGRVVTGSNDFTARVWDTRTGAELLALKGHTAAVKSVAFSPDGGRVVTGGEDGTARVWDARTGAELLALKGHTAAVMKASFSPDGGRVLTASNDGTARIWGATPVR